MSRTPIRLGVLPHERAALLRWNLTPEVRAQLKTFVSSDSPETIEIRRVDLIWPATELTHAIVKRGCRDADVFDLSERLVYVLETGDGSLDGWHRAPTHRA